MKNLRRVHFIVMVIGLSAITIMYWLAADPPNVWFLSFMGGAALLCIGITIARSRAGHFDAD
jgi:hypothetical protein